MYKITKNIYDFKPEELFMVGKRVNNNKRSFLFISKLLGKHLAVNPDVVKASGYLLSSLKYGFNNDSFINCIKNNETPDYATHATDNCLVIGFCETATGLGMAVASSINGCTYQTTTRELINNMNKVLSFEEEHSHATTHSMFSNTTKLDNFEEIILVDDEITTGNSLLNLISEIIKVCNVKKFNVMTILDWRNDEQRELFNKFSNENNISINVYSVIEGYLENIDITVYPSNNSPMIYKSVIPSASLDCISRTTVLSNFEKMDYFSNSGRFGVTYKNIEKTELECKNAANKIFKRVNEKNILILGHGENIYIPSRIASYLKELGKNVVFKTTTLSPIFCDGEIIKDEELFYDRGNVYHFYNKVEAESYDKVILLVETPISAKLCNNLIIYKL